jgi:hydrogenase maturation factor HypF (carbamoyltransferase family)
MIPKDATICPDCKRKVKDKFIEKFVDGFFFATFGGVAFLIKRILNKLNEKK